MPKMIVEKSSLIPEFCPSCGSVLQVLGIHLVCVNHQNCRDQNVGLILHFVQNCGMEQFAESQVKALYDAGKIKTAKDLYSLTEKSFEGIDGFGEKKVKNALSEIQRTKEMSLPSFIDKLSITGVGEKLVNKLGIKTLDDFLNFKNPEGYEYGKNIVAFVKENRDYILELVSVIKIKEIKEEKVNKNAKKVCCTGFRPHSDHELSIIKKNGHIVVDSFNNDTQLILVKDICKESGKTIKAKKMNIEIQSYDQYFKL